MSLNGKISIYQHATDKINVSTLKRIKIVKDQEKWVTRTNGSDMESGHSTLPFEGDETMLGDDQNEEDTTTSLILNPLMTFRAQVFHRLPSIFITDNFFNILNGCINSLTSLSMGFPCSFNKCLLHKLHLMPILTRSFLLPLLRRTRFLFQCP